MRNALFEFRVCISCRAVSFRVVLWSQQVFRAYEAYLPAIDTLSKLLMSITSTVQLCRANHQGGTKGWLQESTDKLKRRSEWSGRDLQIFKRSIEAESPALLPPTSHAQHQYDSTSNRFGDDSLVIKVINASTTIWSWDSNARPSEPLLQ